MECTKQETKKAAHSPLPWASSKHGTPDYSPQFGIYSETTDSHSDLAIVRGEANAELIVLACNAHESLVRSLSGMVGFYETQFSEAELEGCKLIEDARAALKLAGAR